MHNLVVAYTHVWHEEGVLMRLTAKTVCRIVHCLLYMVIVQYCCCYVLDGQVKGEHILDYSCSTDCFIVCNQSLRAMS